MAIGKVNTPRKFMPSVRVGAMRPIRPGGTAVERRVFQRSSNDLHLLVLLGLVAGDAADVDHFRGTHRFDQLGIEIPGWRTNCLRPWATTPSALFG